MQRDNRGGQQGIAQPATAAHASSYASGTAVPGLRGQRQLTLRKLTASSDGFESQEDIASDVHCDQRQAPRPAGAAAATVSAPTWSDVEVEVRARREIDAFLLRLPLGTDGAAAEVERQVGARLLASQLAAHRLQAKLEGFAGVAEELRGVVAAQERELQRMRLLAAGSPQHQGSNSKQGSPVAPVSSADAQRLALLEEQVAVQAAALEQQRQAAAAARGEAARLRSALLDAELGTQRLTVAGAQLRQQLEATRQELHLKSRLHAELTSSLEASGRAAGLAVGPAPQMMSPGAAQPAQAAPPAGAGAGVEDATTAAAAAAAAMAQLHRLQQEHQTVLGQLGAAQARCSVAEAAAERAEQQLQAQAGRLAELEGRGRREVEEAAGRARQEAAGELAALRAQVADREAACAQLQAQAAELATQCEVLQAAMAIKSEDAERLVEQVGLLAQELRAKQAATALLQDQAAAVAGRVAAMDEAVGGQYAALLEYAAALGEQVAALRSGKQKAEAAVAELTAANARLEAERQAAASEAEAAKAAAAAEAERHGVMMLELLEQAALLEVRCSGVQEQHRAALEEAGAEAAARAAQLRVRAAVVEAQRSQLLGLAAALAAKVLQLEAAAAQQQQQQDNACSTDEAAAALQLSRRLQEAEVERDEAEVANLELTRRLGALEQLMRSVAAAPGANGAAQGELSPASSRGGYRDDGRFGSDGEEQEEGEKGGGAEGPPAAGAVMLGGAQVPGGGSAAGTPTQCKPAVEPGTLGSPGHDAVPHGKLPSKLLAAFNLTALSPPQSPSGSWTLKAMPSSGI